MAVFEGYERRIAQIMPTLARAGIASLDEAKLLCESKGLDIPGIVHGGRQVFLQGEASDCV